MDLSILHNPLVVAAISSGVAKHSTDLAKSLMTQASQRPWVKTLLPWIAAAVAYGLNGFLAWISGGNVMEALTVTGPMAGTGAVFYNEVIKPKSK